MFDKISNSWQLAKASMNVLRSDKELLIFPLISGIGAILVMITFLVPFIASGFLQAMAESSTRRGDIDGSTWVPGLILMFLFYVVTYFVTFYCNTALVGAALIRLRGGDPTISDGFRIANSRIGNILGYAVISATVGMILRAISERGGIIGSIVSGILGFGWTVATFLVVPILAIEEVSPIDAVKRSTELLKKTWGENLVANFGIGTVFGWMIAGVIFLIFIPLLIIGASIESGMLMVASFVLLVVALIVLSLFSSALTGIYQAALYRYAMDGEIGGDFDSNAIEQAFKPKR